MFRVNKERFEREYNNHIGMDPLKHVNWYADEEKVNFFITTTSEIFYYQEQIGESFSAIAIQSMTKEGEILGIENNSQRELLNGLGELSGQIKFNMLSQVR